MVIRKDQAKSVAETLKNNGYTAKFGPCSQKRACTLTTPHVPRNNRDGTSNECDPGPTGDHQVTFRTSIYAAAHEVEQNALLGIKSTIVKTGNIFIVKEENHATNCSLNFHRDAFHHHSIDMAQNRPKTAKESQTGHNKVSVLESHKRSTVAR